MKSVAPGQMPAELPFDITRLACGCLRLLTVVVGR
jgi:hypothetical protein